MRKLRHHQRKIWDSELIVEKIYAPITKDFISKYLIVVRVFSILSSLQARKSRVNCQREITDHIQASWFILE